MPAQAFQLGDIDFLDVCEMRYLSCCGGHALRNHAPQADDLDLLRFGGRDGGSLARHCGGHAAQRGIEILARDAPARTRTLYSREIYTGLLGPVTNRGRRHDTVARLRSGRGLCRYGGGWRRCLFRRGFGLGFAG